MPPINVLIKPASGLCNMSCDYCFYCDEAKNRSFENYGMMSQETLKNVIKKTMFHAQGYVSYLFQGGEPTLCGLDFFRSVIAYQKRFNRNQIRVYNALQTNGYAIDEEWCRFFREQDFLIGLSVDGTQLLHDRYRHDRQGKGTYERVLRAADLFDRYQVEYNILTVVTTELAQEIGKVYETYRKRGWHYQQYILCLDPLGEKAGSSPYSLTPKQYGTFLTELFTLWYQDRKKGTQPYIREFENYIRILQGYLPENCAMRGHCTIQNVVEADGSVYPCDFYALDAYCMGNYNTQKFAEIQSCKTASEFVENSRHLSEDCVKCPYQKLCRGGCRRNRSFSEAENGYKNEYCEGYRLFFENCLEKLTEAAEQQGILGQG